MKPILNHNFIRSLASQKTGIYAGLSTVALLMLGSLFLPDPRGSHPLPFNEDLHVFFSPMQWHYSWFYLLILATTMYGLSTFAALLLSLAQKQWNRHKIAVLLLHSGFLIGLLAHLIAGTGSYTESNILIGKAPQNVKGRSVQLVDIQRSYNRDGSIRSYDADLLLDAQPTVLGFNQPVFINLSTFLLIQGEGQGYAIALSNASGLSYQFANSLWYGRFRLNRISTHPSLRQPMISVTDLTTGKTNWYAPGMTLPNGSTLQGIMPYKGIQAQVRHNRGLLLMLLASLLFIAGLLLFLPEIRP